MRYPVGVVVALVALALGASACGGGSNPSLISPSPTPGGGTGPAWAVAGDLRFRTLPGRVGASLPIEMQMVSRQPNIELRFDVAITAPNGKVATMVWSGHTPENLGPGWYGSGNFWPETPGSHAVVVRVRQSFEGQQGPEDTRNAVVEVVAQ